MSQAADRAGNFRAEITEYGLREQESGAVAVTLRVKLLEFWDDGQWHPWEQYDMEAFGDVWIVKKENGGINQKAVESLMRHAGWNGDVNAIVSGAWQPTLCQVVINEDTYQGITRYKVSFVNDYHRSPGAVGNVTDDKAKQLAGKYGSQLRAIFGGIKRNTAVPENRPAAPPSKTPGVDPAQQRRANAAMQEAASGDDFPF